MCKRPEAGVFLCELGEGPERYKPNPMEAAFSRGGWECPRGVKGGAVVIRENVLKFP